MKNILVAIIIAGISLNLNAQKLHSVEWYNWSNPITYKLSPSPYIAGYGFYSDSLSKLNNGETFYEANGEYYQIESWADYYFWYVNKYWYQFENPELYEYYYNIKDDFQMASYIASRSYKGRYYPSEIYLVFNDKHVDYNRLNKKSRYIASNERQIRRLNQTKEPTREPKGKYLDDKKSKSENIVYINNEDKPSRTKANSNYRPDKFEKNNLKSNAVYRKPISTNNKKTNYNNSSNTSHQRVSNAPKQK